MGDIYLYGANETDFDNIGICGALMANECKFNEIANGNATLTLTHPRDEYGKFALIERGMILKADVPVRTTPEITNGQYVTTVYEYTVLNTATKEQRKIWNTRDKTKDKRKCLKVAGKDKPIVVVKTFANANYFTKVKYTYKTKKKNKTVTGFIDPAALSEAYVTKTITATPDGMDAVADSWSIKEQLFRIESVEKTESEVTVTAHHISYDFMYNLTSYNADGTKTLQEALDGVFENTFEPHGFDAQTNITSSLTGFHYADKDPITALLDPDDGLVPRFDGELVRDNYMFTILDHAGTNRGYRIEYGKNMTGISWQIDETSIAGAIRPYGETKKGNKLYLNHSFIANDDYSELTQVSGDDQGLVYSPRYYTYSNGTLTGSLPYTRIYAMQGDDCKATVDSGDDAEASDITPAMVRTRLKDQALKALKDGADVPEVSISVDIKQLGNSVQYADFAELEKVFLFDTVLVYHRRMGILADAVVSAIEWDCIQDELTGITLGTIRDLSSSIASWQIVQLNGGKIMPSTIPGSAIQPGTISAQQIMAHEIDADLIKAHSITANEILAHTITADEIAALTITADQIAAHTITADKIYGNYASFADLVASNLTVDTMNAKLISAGVIDANTGFIKNTVMGTSSISDLFAAEVDALHIFVNHLWIKNANSQYQQVTIDSNGQVVATSLLGDRSISGTKIIENTITADLLNATQIFANSAIIAALTASSIWATEGWIANLKAANVMGNGGLRLSSSGAYNTYIQVADPQTAGLELRVGDVWVKKVADSSLSDNYKYQCRTWNGSSWEVIGTDSTNEPHGNVPPPSPSYLTVWIDLNHSRVWRYWDDNWQELGGIHTFDAIDNPARAVVRESASSYIRQYSHVRAGDIWNDPQAGISYRTIGNRRWVMTTRKLFWQSEEPTERGTGIPLEIGDMWLHSGNRDIWNGAGWERYTTGVYGQDAAPDSPGEGWIWADTDGAVVTIATGVIGRPVYEYTRWRRFTNRTFKQDFEPYGELINGDTWITSANVVYTYNGSSWQKETYNYYQSSAPTNPKTGEIWCDSTTGRTYTYGTNSWVRTKPYSTTGATPPTDPTPINGDTWFCTATNSPYFAGCSYEYTGGAWKVRNGELHNSYVDISPSQVSIHTPVFEVDIQQSGSETTELRVNEDGVNANTISANNEITAPEIHADNLQEVYTGPTVIQAYYNTIDEIIEGLNGKHLAEDVVVKVAVADGSANTRPYVHDISGAKLIFVPNNLLCNPWSAVSKYTFRQIGCTASGSLSPPNPNLTLTNSTASSNNYRMYYLGNIGALGLRGKRMRFATKVYGNGYARYELLIGKPIPGGGIRTTTWWGETLSKGTTSSNAVVTATTFNLNYNQIDNIDDCELFFTLWCGSSSAGTAANTSVTYMNTALEIGDEFTSADSSGLSTLLGNGGGLKLNGCDVRDCSSHIVFSEAMFNSFARINNANVSFNICAFPKGSAPSSDTIMGVASVEQFGGQSCVYGCAGGDASTPFAIVRGGGTMTIEAGIQTLTGTAGYKPSGTTSGMVTEIGSPTASGGGGDPSQTQTYTRTWQAADHDTYWGSWASSDDDLRTGTVTAHSNMRGWCTFATSAIPAGATVQSAVLKIKRMNGYGVSGKVDLRVTKSTSTAKPSGAPNESGTTISKSDFIAEGETKRLDVKDLITVNAYNAFVFSVANENLISGKAYSKNFARYSGSALELTVTYTV